MADDDERRTEFSDLADHKVPEDLINQMGFRNIDIVLMVFLNEVVEVVFEGRQSQGENESILVDIFITLFKMKQLFFNILAILEVFGFFNSFKELFLLPLFV